MIAEALEDTGRLWKLNDGHISPDADDVRKLLDEAARLLYDSAVGDRITTGGLIIEKTDTGFDVYVHFGTYY